MDETWKPPRASRETVVRDAVRDECSVRFSYALLATCKAPNRARESVPISHPHTGNAQSLPISLASGVSM
eukprot:3341614-Alexandrium_andersonii.AAC.1